MIDPQLRKKLQARIETRQKKYPSWEGILGDGCGDVRAYNGDGTVRPGYAIVMKNGDPSNLTEVKNPTSEWRYGAWVTCGKEASHPGEDWVLGLSTHATAYMNAGVGPHAPAHYWLNSDPVSVDLRAITWLGVRATAPESMSVIVIRGMVTLADSSHVLISTQTVDLSSYQPVAADKLKWVLIYVDTAGELAVADGSEIDWGTTCSAPTNYPARPDDCLYELAAVRLYEGQSTVMETTEASDIVDLRTLGGNPHNHKLDALLLPEDNTNGNATTSAHGLLPKLAGGTTRFLRADGAWAVPPTGGGEAGTSSAALNVYLCKNFI